MLSPEDIQYRVKGANIPSWGWDWTFESFPELSEFGRTLQLWTDDPNPPQRGVVLYGPPGRGKTGLAIAALRQKIEDDQGPGFGWLLSSGPDLERRIQDGLETRQSAPLWFETWADLKGRLLKRPLSSRDDEEMTARDLLRQLDSMTSLLVLDDIDQDNLSPWKEEQLLYLVERPLRGRQVILTMNAEVSSLIDRLGARIVDRLLDPSRYLILHSGKGPSFRR